MLKLKKRYKICLPSGKINIIFGTPIVLKEYEAISFFTYCTKQGKFAIREVKTGCRVGIYADSFKHAIIAARNDLYQNIKTDIKALQRRIILFTIKE